MKVQSTRLGYYGDLRRKAGDIFTINSEEDFSENWMKKLDAGDIKNAEKDAELHKKQALETFAAVPRAAKSSPSRFFGNIKPSAKAAASKKAAPSKEGSESSLKDKVVDAAKSVSAAVKKAASSEKSEA